MRASIALACTSLAVAAAAACAASDESTAGRPAAPPPNETTLPDASVTDAAVEADAVPGLPTCSSDGWCITKLPDMDLVMRDVWPFPNGAFAIAESPTLGIKVLEWSAAPDGEWKYIDDDTQNEIGAGEYAGRLWSPVADEVYFGVAPAFIYHGTRTPTGWTWTRHELPDNSHPGDPAHRVSGHDHGHPESRGLGERYPALGVWGTGKDDVYAWYSNTIFHWQSDDGGAPGWVPEYVADDYDAPDEELFFVAGTGTDRNDVWFSGGRGAQPFSCAIAVRRTPDGYRRIVDAVALGGGCGERPGSVLVSGSEGWLSDIHATSAGAIVGLRGAVDVVRVAPDGDAWMVTSVPIPQLTSETTRRLAFSSLWSSSDAVWLTATTFVMRSPAPWDVDAYRVSSISLNGAPIARPMHQIRGTSNTNLWAIGDRHAFHKTTP